MIRAALLVLLLADPALAHDHAALPDVNACLKTLHSQRGEQCCDGTDALKAELIWDFSADGYVVELANPQTGERKRYAVPSDRRVVNDRCGVGSALLWWSPTYLPDGSMMPMFRCFKPGAGG